MIVVNGDQSLIHFAEVQPAKLIVPAEPRRGILRVSTLRKVPNLLRKMLFQEQIRLLLGRNRYISTSVHNGENLAHLRKFDGHIPLREGVALKLRQTRNLFDATETTDAAADEGWKTLEGQKAEYLVHVGYKTVLNVYLYDGLRYYDVRRYWKAPTQYDAVPT